MKYVRVKVTRQKAAQLKKEARYKDILSFLISERNNLDKRIKRLQKAMEAQRIKNLQKNSWTAADD